MLVCVLRLIKIVVVIVVAVVVSEQKYSAVSLIIRVQLVIWLANIGLCKQLATSVGAYWHFRHKL